jgi:hypothetical protein
MAWATFWAIFSQTHLATLLSGKINLKVSKKVHTHTS